MVSKITEEEIWKDIKGYEGLYEVSNLGRVKSLRKTLPRKQGFHTKPEKILKSFNNGNGYMSVQLYNGDKSKRHYVHRLVISTFTEENLELVVDHRNRVRGDNRLTNLRYLTQRDNTSNKEGTSSPYTGVHFNRVNNKYYAKIRIGDKRYSLGASKDDPLMLSKLYLKAKEDWELFKKLPHGCKYVQNKPKKPKLVKDVKSRAKVIVDTETGIYYNSLKELTSTFNLDYKMTSSRILQNKSKYKYI